MNIRHLKAVVDHQQAKDDTAIAARLAKLVDEYRGYYEEAIRTRGPGKPRENAHACATAGAAYITALELEREHWRKK